jgi:hypothetical protein
MFMLALLAGGLSDLGGFSLALSLLVFGLTLQQLLALPQDRMLSNVAVEFQPVGFVADAVLPVVPVNFESAGYYVFDDTNFNIPEAKRNPRGVYKEIDFGLATDSYKAEEYGIAVRIDDRERRNAPVQINLDIGKTRRATNGILLNRERRVANLVTNTANVTQNTTLAGAAQWSDPTSNPASVARTGRDLIRSKTGVIFNRMAMSYAVYESLRIHPALIDFVEGARPTEADIAEYFEVDQIVVARAIYNSAKEGQASTLADLWGKDALFYFQSPIVQADEPSFGYQFEALALTVFRWRDVPVNCDVIRVNEIRAEKIVSAKLAYLVKAAVA